MPHKILINQSGINATAGNMEKQEQAYRENIRNITKLTISLCDVWEGDSQRKFVAQYNQILPTLEKAAEFYSKYASLMREYSAKISECDRAGANKIKNLF